MCGNMEKNNGNYIYLCKGFFFFPLFLLKFKILSVQVSGEKTLWVHLRHGKGKGARFNDLLK